MVYISIGDHDDPHGLPKYNLEGSPDNVHHTYTNTDIPSKMPEEMQKLEHIYQHFQDHEKIYETNPQVTTEPIHDIYTLRSTMILNMDCLKMLLIAIILIVRLGMIFNVQKFVTYMTPQLAHCTQTHPVHTHMIIFHNNSIP